MHNSQTNAPIAGFPAAPRDIGWMGAATLNAVLTELGLATGGTMQVKRLRLRIGIGLNPDPA
jgi:hypothetical protein